MARCSGGRPGESGRTGQGMSIGAGGQRGVCAGAGKERCSRGCLICVAVPVVDVLIPSSHKQPFAAHRVDVLNGRKAGFLWRGLKWAVSSLCKLGISEVSSEFL